MILILEVLSILLGVYFLIEASTLALSGGSRSFFDFYKYNEKNKDKKR